MRSLKFLNREAANLFLTPVLSCDRIFWGGGCWSPLKGSALQTFTVSFPTRGFFPLKPPAPPPTALRVSLLFLLDVSSATRIFSSAVSVVPARCFCFPPVPLPTPLSSPYLFSQVPITAPPPISLTPSDAIYVFLTLPCISRTCVAFPPLCFSCPSSSFQTTQMVPFDVFSAEFFATDRCPLQIAPPPLIPL